MRRALRIAPAMLEVATILERQRTVLAFVCCGAGLWPSDRFDCPGCTSTWPTSPPPVRPHDERHAKPRTNRFGAKQRSCIHLGDHDMGCRVKAKNTLTRTTSRGHPQGRGDSAFHLVRQVGRDAAAWRVRFDEISSGFASIRDGRARRAGGRLPGSTERCSPACQVSVRLGDGWSPNGDFLTPALSTQEADPSVGPTITARIDHTDGRVYGQKIFIQDGGMPNLLRASVSSWQRRLPRRWRARAQAFIDWASREQRTHRAPVRQVSTPDGVGCDGASSQPAPFPRLGHRARSPPSAIVRPRGLARATDRAHRLPDLDTAARSDAPHPLGGCNTVDDPRRGVVDHAGRVFGQEGLCITDGAIIPAPSAATRSHDRRRGGESG
jgi:cholesterol oxidase